MFCKSNLSSILYGIIRNPSIGKYKPHETWCPIWSQNNKELKLLTTTVAETLVKEGKKCKDLVLENNPWNALYF